MRAWLGGYTADMDGNAAGIGVLLAGAAETQSAGGPLAFAGTAVATQSPSWLAQHPTLDVVYAALEGDGEVRAFTRTGPDALAPLGQPRVAGTLTCNVAVSPDGRWLTAAAYGDGAVVRMPLGDDGTPGEPEFGPLPTDPYGAGGSAAPTPDASLQTVEASLLSDVLAEGGIALDKLMPTPSPAPEVAESAQPAAATREPHAHQARYLPGGLVATTDLGYDLVRFWRDGKVEQEVVLPFGSGPRHGVWHPSGHYYVVTEYSNEVFALAPDAHGKWGIVTATTVSREVTIGADFPAELSLSADGTHLYTGIRGINAIGVLGIRGDGSRLEPVATTDSYVDWPRYHVLVGDTLLVAGQKSDDVVSLAVDARTQIPGRRRESAHVPTPTMILPVFD